MQPVAPEVGDTLVAHRAPEAAQQAECHIARLPGLALCLPGAATQGAGTVGVSGPR